MHIEAKSEAQLSQLNCTMWFFLLNYSLLCIVQPSHVKNCQEMCSALQFLIVECNTALTGFYPSPFVAAPSGNWAEEQTISLFRKCSAYQKAWHWMSHRNEFTLCLEKIAHIFTEFQNEPYFCTICHPCPSDKGKYAAPGIHYLPQGHIMLTEGCIMPPWGWRLEGGIIQWNKYVATLI